MRLKRPLILLLAPLLLAASAAAEIDRGAEPSATEVTASQRGVGRCDQPQGQTAGVATAELDASHAAASAADGREQESAKQRPEAFWWRSPEKVLGSLYGACGPRDCCRVCITGKACGDTCIRASFTCRVGCGCACDKPLFFGEE